MAQNFEEDHLGLISIIITKPLPTASPRIQGVVGQVETVDRQVTRTLTLDNPVELDSDLTLKLVEIVTELETRLKTKAGL